MKFLLSSSVLSFVLKKVTSNLKWNNSPIVTSTPPPFDTFWIVFKNPSTKWRIIHIRIWRFGWRTWIKLSKRFWPNVSKKHWTPGPINSRVSLFELWFLKFYNIYSVVERKWKWRNRLKIFNLKCLVTNMLSKVTLSKWCNKHVAVWWPIADRLKSRCSFCKACKFLYQKWIQNPSVVNSH